MDVVDILDVVGGRLNWMIDDRRSWHTVTPVSPVPPPYRSPDADEGANRGHGADDYAYKFSGSEAILCVRLEPACHRARGLAAKGCYVLDGCALELEPEPELVVDEPPLLVSPPPVPPLLVPPLPPPLPLPLSLLDVELDESCVGVACVPPEPAEVRGSDAAVDCTSGCVVEELEATVPGGSGLKVTPRYEHVNTWLSRTATEEKHKRISVGHSHRGVGKGSYTGILDRIRFEGSSQSRGHHTNSTHRPYEHYQPHHS